MRPGTWRGLYYGGPNRALFQWQGHWFPSDRSPCRLTVTSRRRSRCSCRAPICTALPAYAGSSPRGLPFQRNPENSRQGQHPPSMESLECESQYLLLCRIQKCSGCHPKGPCLHCALTWGVAKPRGPEFFRTSPLLLELTCHSVFLPDNQN